MVNLEKTVHLSNNMAATAEAIRGTAKSAADPEKKKDLISKLLLMLVSDIKQYSDTELM